MRNKSIIRIMSVMGKLLSSTPRDLVNDGFLQGIETRTINTYRANYHVKLNGRKWLAPLYRPVVSTFTIKVGTFLAVRANKGSVDLEWVEGAESVTYTVKGQDWREKQHYFLLIPPERLRGPLGDTVRQIYELRRSQNEQQSG